jgi:hypothetical protein
MRGTYRSFPNQSTKWNITWPVIYSIVFASFGFAFGQMTRITRSLLSVEGRLLAVSKIVESTIASNLYLAIALPYLYLIAIGFILMGLVLVGTVRRK